MSDLISRQAVIDRINKLIEVEEKQGTDDWGYGRERVNAYEAMLHMVESEYLHPSVEPEKSQCSWYGEDRRCHFAEQEMDECDDCISRQAVLDIAKSSKSNWIDNSVLFKRVSELPSVEPERKPGKWLPHMVTAKCESIDRDVCSECRTCFYGEPTWSWKYCPKCGKPMEEKDA